MINRISSLDAAIALTDLILPRKCLVCGCELAMHERHLCLSCLADLPRTHFSSMPRNQMADRFNDLIQRDARSLSLSKGPSQSHRTPYSYATALFFYRSGTGYRNITRSLKYHSNIAAGRYFGEILGREMASSGLYSDVDTVIPVPLHWTRRWSRGYNQAEIIARAVAGRLGAKTRTDILWRPRRTRSQAHLSIEEKAANVSGAFKVKNEAALKGCHHVLLVDDVFTTGATLHSCYRAINASGNPPGRVSVATLACVGC